MTSSATPHTPASRVRAANWLGVAGLIPFVACALLIVFSGSRGAMTGAATDIFIAYSIAILSFLGGIRWGHAIAGRGIGEGSGSDRDVIVTLGLSVLPALLALSTVFLPQPYAVALLLVGFCLQGVWDSFSAHGGKLPRWFAPLRMGLTIVVVLCHAVVFLVLAVG